MVDLTIQKLQSCDHRSPLSNVQTKEENSECNRQLRPEVENKRARFINFPCLVSHFSRLSEDIYSSDPLVTIDSGISYLRKPSQNAQQETAHSHLLI